MHATDDLDGPTSHSQRLKVEYDRVVRALYQDMTRFCTPGVESGVAEVAELLERSEKSLRNQFGPTSYDHAPTVHAFLQVLETLRSQATVQEIARLADCVTIPRSPSAKAVGAPADDPAAFAALADRVRAVEAAYPTFDAAQHPARPLTQRERTAARDRLHDLIAYAAHLITRLD